MFDAFLFLTSNVPYKKISGDRIATFNTIKGLKLLHPNVKIGVLTFYSKFDNQYIDLLSKEVDFVYPIKKTFFIRSVWKAFLEGKSLVMGRFFSKNYLNKLKEIAPNYNVISAEHTYMAQYFKFLYKHSNRQKFIVNIHVLEFPRYNFLYHTEKNILKKLMFKYERRRLFQEEIDSVSNADVVLSYGEFDDRLIKKHIKNILMRVQPLPIDILNYEYSQIEDEKDNQILFFGDYNWFPNYDALIYILNEIWPLALNLSKKIELKLIGRHLPRRTVEKIIREKKLFNIEVIGEVQDIQKYIKESAVIIAPLRMGGGARLKILESLAMGKIVITTKEGAEGIFNKSVLIIANNSTDFAKKMVVFSSDKKIRGTYKEKSRGLIKNTYDLSVSIITFLENLTSL